MKSTDVRFISGTNPMISSRNCTLQQSSVNRRETDVRLPEQALPCGRGQIKLRVRRCHAVRVKQRTPFPPSIREAVRSYLCMQVCKRTNAVPFNTGSQKGQPGYQIKRSLQPSQSLILTEVRGRELTLRLRSSSAVNGSCFETDPGL